MESLNTEPIRRARPLDARPFVARAPELATLERALGAARRGLPRVVLISGDAGIGKTRLLRRLQQLASDRGFEVLTGRCLEHVDLPYHPFEGTLFPRLLDAARAEPTLAEAAAVIASSLDRSVPDPAAGGAAAAREQLWLFRSVARAASALARRRPLLVTVDDLQWADGPSADLFVHVGQEMADAAVRAEVPILLAATHRTEPDTPLGRHLARLEREEIVHALAVRGLGERETAELLRSLGLEHPSRQLVDLVVRTTHGNPLLVEAAVEYLSRGALRDEGGQLVATDLLLDLPLPHDLSDAARARIDRLDDADRRVLATAAVIGEPFRTTVLARLCNCDPEAADRALRAAVTAHVVTREGDGYVFAHPVFARVLLGVLSDAEREGIHLAAARVLAESAAERGEQSLAVAFHYAQSGAEAPPAEVARACVLGGERAWQLAAWGEAARDFDAAATAEARAGAAPEVIADLHRRAGDAHCRNMDPGPGRERFARAADGFRRAGDVRGEARRVGRAPPCRGLLGHVRATGRARAPGRTGPGARGDRPGARCARAVPARGSVVAPGSHARRRGVRRAGARDRGRRRGP